MSGRKLFLGTEISLGTGFPDLIAEDQQFAVQNRSGAIEGANNIKFYDARALHEAQSPALAISQYLTPNTRASVFRVTGMGTVKLIDLAYLRAGGMVSFIFEEPGVKLIHGFDKTSIPVIDRPGNYATLAAINMASNRNYMTTKANEAFIFRAILSEDETTLELYEWGGHGFGNGSTIIELGDFVPTLISPTVIGLNSDYTEYAKTGDVLKVTFDDDSFSYVRIKSINASSVTVEGVPLVGTVANLELGYQSRFGVALFGLRIPDENIYRYGETRPTVRTTPGGTLAAPSNAYGTDVFFDMSIPFPSGYLIAAHLAAEDCGSSATPAAVKIYDGTDEVGTVSASTTLQSAVIDSDFYLIGQNGLKITLSSPGGNADALGLTLWVFLFQGFETV